MCCRCWWVPFLLFLLSIRISRFGQKTTIFLTRFWTMTIFLTKKKYLHSPHSYWYLFNYLYSAYLPYPTWSKHSTPSSHSSSPSPPLRLLPQHHQHPSTLTSQQWPKEKPHRRNCISLESVNPKTMAVPEIICARTVDMCLQRDQLRGLNWMINIDVLPADPKSFALKRFPRDLHRARLRRRRIGLESKRSWFRVDRGHDGYDCTGLTLDWCIQLEASISCNI